MEEEVAAEATPVSKELCPVEKSNRKIGETV
jgi:hypothetical protein